MTKEGIQYYFEVQAIAGNGNQQDYLEDGEPVSSLASGANTPGITDGTWEIIRRAAFYLSGWDCSRRPVERIDGNVLF